MLFFVCKERTSHSSHTRNMSKGRIVCLNHLVEHFPFEAIYTRCDETASNVYTPGMIVIDIKQDYKAHKAYMRTEMVV